MGWCHRKYKVKDINVDNHSVWFHLIRNKCKSYRDCYHTIMGQTGSAEVDELCLRYTNPSSSTYTCALRPALYVRRREKQTGMIEQNPTKRPERSRAEETHPVWAQIISLHKSKNVCLCLQLQGKERRMYIRHSLITFHPLKNFF